MISIYANFFIYLYVYFNSFYCSVTTMATIFRHVLSFVGKVLPGLLFIYQHVTIY